MARKDRNLSAFPTTTNVDFNHSEQNEETDNQENSTEQLNVTSNSNIESVTKDVIPDDESKTLRQAKEELLGLYKEKTKKQTVEDTHTRATFLFRNDLQKRLDKLSKGKRGFKTLFINTAIENLLDEMERK